MNIIRGIFSCFTGKPAYGYLEKKDDDTSIEEMRGGVEDNPVRGDLTHTETSAVYAFAREIIRSLKTIEVNSSNQEMLKERLAGIAEESMLVREYFIDNLDKINAPKEVRQDVTSHIIGVYTRKI